MPCAVFVAIKVTPGMTAPLGSFKVPEILPVVAACDRLGRIVSIASIPAIAAARRALIL
jgi:hypothetical protein